MTLQPLAQMPRAVATAAHTVMLDIDDTLTTHGRLSAPAYTALQSLHEAGLRVVPVTGRPAGWCDHIARSWPVDAVVGENGALVMWHDAAQRKLCRFDWAGAEAGARLQARLAQVRERILREVPGCAVASDQFCRIYDLAIDFCEDVPALPAAEVDRIARIMREEGMTAKVSSIHVNGWFGEWNKLAMAERLLRERWGVDLAQPGEAERVIFIGDSPNDEPMFEAFPNAVGVANVLDHLRRLRARPAWITQGRAGEGFEEMALRVLALRR